MKIIIFVLICCLSAAYVEAQPGCTDPLALNFDPSATQNDGSCTYPPTPYAPPQVAELPDDINEASGLAFFGGQLWLHEDGGTSPMLHSLDTLTAQPLQGLALPGTQNHDWEDLAEDDTHLYVGDFGNNAGDRTNLRIFKIAKSGLLSGNPTAEVIAFSFSDQTDFTPAWDATNHDCEAFVAFGDSLHVFSKRWLDYTTHRYTLPNTPGTHVAMLRDSFDTGFLVTAADLSTDGTLLLLGYDGNTSETSLLMLWDYPGTAVFHGNKRRLTLGTALNMSQAEGIAFSSHTTGFICSEAISFLPPRLLRFDIGQWLQPPPSAMGELHGRPVFSASPNPCSASLHVDFQGIAKQGDLLTLCSADGRTLRSQPLRNGSNTLPTGDLPKGTYFIFAKNGNKTWAQQVVKP